MVLEGKKGVGGRRRCAGLPPTALETTDPVTLVLAQVVRFMARSFRRNAGHPCPLGPDSPESQLLGLASWSPRTSCMVTAWPGGDAHFVRRGRSSPLSNKQPFVLLVGWLRRAALFRSDAEGASATPAVVAERTDFFCRLYRRYLAVPRPLLPLPMYLLSWRTLTLLRGTRPLSTPD